MPSRIYDAYAARLKAKGRDVLLSDPLSVVLCEADPPPGGYALTSASRPLSGVRWDGDTLRADDVTYPAASLKVAGAVVLWESMPVCYLGLDRVRVADEADFTLELSKGILTL